MELFDAIFQGVLQGLTEFLPVSSSGHLAIYQHITGITENNLFFSVMLHIGTLAAVTAVYFKIIFRLFAALGSLLKKIFTGKFKWKEMTDQENLAMMIIIGLLPLFLLFIPVPGTDMKIKDLAEKFSANDGYFFVIGILLVATSLLLFFGNKNRQPVKIINGKRYRKKLRTRYTWVDALVVGFTQCLAVSPGLSRSGSTLAVSQLRGIEKQTALDYSFLLGTPAVVAAALLELKDVLTASEGDPMNINIGYVIAGMIVSTIVGFLAIKLFKWLLGTNRMYIFILYTAAVGLAILLISIIELSSGTNLFTQKPLTF